MFHGGHEGSILTLIAVKVPVLIDEDDERRAMLRLETFRGPRTDSARASYIEEYDREFNGHDTEDSDSMTTRLIESSKKMKDTSGRVIPASERAPVG